MSAAHPKLVLGALARKSPNVPGKTRLLRRVDAAISALSSSPVRSLVGGVRYELQTRDLIDFRTLYFGGYSLETAKYLEARVRSSKGRVFWDVGANVGSITLPVAHRVPDARVFAFEPSPPVHQRLVTNVSLNRQLALRIDVLDVALGAESGEAAFYVSNEDFNSGVGGLSPADNRTQEHVTVEVIRGDDLVSAGRATAPDVIKVDAEGAEPAVLAGLEAQLRGDRLTTVLFEHSLYRMEAQGTPRRQLVDLLRARGFSLFVLVGSEPRPLTDADLDTDCDIAAQR